MTLANKVTSIRFLLSLTYFGVLAWIGRHPDPVLTTVAFVLFLVAAFSDLLDGWLARRYGEVTPFGRVADPLVDKILVCGSLIFFLELEPPNEVIAPWFVVVVLAREFLVSGIRGAAEAAGIPFGANAWGKLKTVVQNVTVGTALGYAAFAPGQGWAKHLLAGLVWLTLAATVISGATYAMDARRLLRSGRV